MDKEVETLALAVLTAGRVALTRQYYQFKPLICLDQYIDDLHRGRRIDVLENINTNSLCSLCVSVPALVS
jgi:hypothetical protein